MHLRANRNVSVIIDALGMCVPMKEGETIRTEVCGKFSRESAEEMAEEADLRINRWFTDPQGWFSLIELTRQDWE